MKIKRRGKSQSTCDIHLSKLPSELRVRSLDDRDRIRCETFFFRSIFFYVKNCRKSYKCSIELEKELIPVTFNLRDK